jgi:hypothetical protein
MPNKTAAIMLDRLHNALVRQGVTLKRHALLEVAACAFGHRNSNEFTASAKKGDLTPPPALPIGTIMLPTGEEMIILRDQTANSPYGICSAFVEQVVEDVKSETIGITPYGHLAWLGDVAAAVIPPIEAKHAAAHDAKVGTMHLGIVTHKHGENEYLATTRELLEAQIDAYCVENWFEIQGADDVPEDPTVLSPGEAMRIYFEIMEEREAEWVSTSEVEPDGAEASVTMDPEPAETASVLEDLERSLAARFWSELAQGDDVAGDLEAMRQSRETREAIGRAIALLRSDPVPTTTRNARLSASGIDPADEPVWITDSQGDDTFQVSRAMLQRLGLPYGFADDEYLPLTDREYEVLGANDSTGRYGVSIRLGMSVLYKGIKHVAPEITFDFGDPEGQDPSREEALAQAKAFMAMVREDVEALGGHLILTEDATDYAHELTVLLPFHVATQSGTPEDWKAALSYLLRPARLRAGGVDVAEQKQVEAVFNPQAWMRDYAYSVDCQGDSAWDATFDLLLCGWDEVEKAVEGTTDFDFLKDSPLAPKWVQDWSGPFEVEIDAQDVDALFNVIR